jgi:hypothetical protein
MNKDELALFRKEILNREKVAVKIFGAFTWVVWVMIFLNFITQGEIIVPAGLWSNYLVILTGYVLTKEVSRWRMHVIRHRHGDWFVGLWVVTGLIFWIIIGITHKYGYNVKCPKELNWLVAQIVVYYIGGQYSRSAYYKTLKKTAEQESQEE